MTSKPKMFTIAQQKYAYNWLKKKYPTSPAICVQTRIDNFEPLKKDKTRLDLYVTEKVNSQFSTYDEFLEWKASQS